MQSANSLAIVLHSGGMDSSICLGLAARKFGPSQVISLGFRYKQRHEAELDAAATIANHLSVRRLVIDVPVIPGWESSSLLEHSLPIGISNNSLSSMGIPNSFITSRNGLFLMMAAPLARVVGARHLYIGVMEREGANSGYPDCSRNYIDLVQSVIRADLQDPGITIETPLCTLSKAETLEIAHDVGILEYLLQHTISCYEGKPILGCTKCPACRLRNEGIATFYRGHPELIPPAPFLSLLE